jgi:hypothetical protein
MEARLNGESSHANDGDVALIRKWARRQFM